MADRRAAKAAAKKKDNPSAKRKKTETKIRYPSVSKQPSLGRKNKRRSPGRWRVLRLLSSGDDGRDGDHKTQKERHTAESTCDSPARSHCPHVVDVIDREVDNVSTTDAASVDQPRQSQQPERNCRLHNRLPALSKLHNLKCHLCHLLKTSFDDETLNSELDGEDGADPDEWYIEPETEASPDTTDVNASLDEVDACEEPEEAASDESDGGGGVGWCSSACAPEDEQLCCSAS
ncbi:hypothetical protein PI124_g17916 [Phytophthora idaei]|nr:hypothetical protein PI126_g14693 [Phytophthora idaei]KAG3237087.1 hypothetical protein PI124_g17916 [Phytophthora idaei]